MSPAVITIADAYVASPPVPHQTQDLISIRRDFLQAFFGGFTELGAQMSSPNNAKFYGFLAGQKFRSENPSKINETMEAYGYTFGSVEGTLVFGDKGGFHPNTCPEEVWQCEAFDEQNNWPQLDMRRDGLKVILRGYLSPTRYFGERYVGDHQIFVADVQFIDD
jgi:hypothetical protein